MDQIFDSYGLTPREKEVAGFLLKGKSNQEIAEIDIVDVVTIRTHAMKIYHKTGIKGANKNIQLRNKFASHVQ